MQRRRLALVLVLFAGLLSTATAQSSLDKTKVGEWILTRNQRAITPEPFYLYMWVSKIEGRKATVMTQRLKSETIGAQVAGAPTVIDLDHKEAPRPSNGTAPVTEELTIKGRKIVCLRTEGEVSAGLITVAWESSEIPILALAKSETRDKSGKVLSTTECIDFGHEGGAEKPLK